MRGPLATATGHRNPAPVRWPIIDQWRVCFAWTDRGAIEIEVTDYH